MKTSSILMAATLLALAVTATATAQPLPTALWGKAVQGTKGTKVTSQGADIQTAPDGAVYVSGGAGTKTTSDIVRMGDDTIAAPQTEYQGQGDTGTQNLFITRLTADGQPQWTVYSHNGQLLSGSALMRPVADGLIVAFGIEHVDGHRTESPQIIDGMGQPTDLQWQLGSATDKRYYRMVVMRLSTDGAIEWLRQIEADHSTTDQAVALYGLLTDGEGDIYIAGELRAAIYVPRQDGSTETVANAGGVEPLLLKLDAQGCYLGRMAVESSMKEAKLRAVTTRDGRIYAMGTLTGTPGATLTMGGQTLTAPNQWTTAFTACIGTDLHTQWVNTVTSTESNFNMQQNTLCATADALYLAGMAAVSIATREGKSLVVTKEMNRQATLLKFSRDNGELMDGYLKPLFQTGYFALMEDSEGGIHAAGYAGVLVNRQLPENREKPSGLFVEHFQPASIGTGPSGTWQDLIGNIVSGQGWACNAEGRLYTLTRSNVTDNVLVGGTVGIAQDYAINTCNVCAFQLPLTPATEVREVHTKTAGNTTVTGRYFDLQGRSVAHPTASGIYILRPADGHAPSRKVVVSH